jgi:hypothetical protein
MVRKQSLKKNKVSKKIRKIIRRKVGNWFQPGDNGGRLID